MSSEITFPRQYARTQRFSLGAPRAFSVAGDRVVFLRSRSGEDRATCLWAYDPDSGERVIADPRELLGGADENLSPEERARRERSREGSAGIVGYALDDAGEVVAFTLSGRLFAGSPATGDVRELPVPGPVIDPRPDPSGRRVAYVAGGALRVVGTDGTGDAALAEPDAPQVTWGLAEFVAAEEMQRSRGHWWLPDGSGLIVARVDNSPVDRWWIGDPANPSAPAAAIDYPAAGTANADVTAWLVRLDGSRTELAWDREAFPYLVNVRTSAHGDPLLVVMSRDQRTVRVLAAGASNPAAAANPAGANAPAANGPAAGTALRLVHEHTDPVWIDIVPGVPAWAPDGRLVRLEDRDGVRRLVAGDTPVTDGALHVRQILDIGEDDIWITASAGPAADDGEEIGEIHVVRVTDTATERITTTPGVHTAARGGALAVLVSSAPDRSGATVTVLRDGKAVGEIASFAATPVITPRVELVTAGPRRIPCAVLLPTGYDPAGGEPLPVLLDPYGGPHGQRVVAARNPHLTSQWFADQGFAVVVADGRGTPHRSPDWEKAVHHDFAGVTLEDQVAALTALAAERPYLDLSRVGIRGWSYGGYLAALAVLRRPDVFHAAVAGAPVTDWALYDTHYTERYLGHPAEHPGVYAANSLVTGADLGEVADPVRPLMIIHGLADDNVVAAHTLRLSSALLAAGRPHQVLPLSGVTHMTPQEQVAENLLLLQVDFLRRALGMA